MNWKKDLRCRVGQSLPLYSKKKNHHSHLPTTNTTRSEKQTNTVDLTRTTTTKTISPGLSRTRPQRSCRTLTTHHPIIPLLPFDPLPPTGNPHLIYLPNSVLTAWSRVDF
uniref:Uncharacterized protein n=1 Tax=Cacopsylla melanoneura TaxID=428564 RepID=A0A8D8RS40_9HEMI